MTYTNFNKPPGNHRWIIGLDDSYRPGWLYRHCRCGFQLSWSPTSYIMAEASWLWRFGNKSKWNHYQEKEMPSDIISKECLAHAMNEALV